MKVVVDCSVPGGEVRRVPLTAEELAQRELDLAEGFDTPGVVGVRIDLAALRDAHALAAELVPDWHPWPGDHRRA